MAPTVEVRSVEALEDLRASLIRYADETQRILDATEREAQRTLEWLEERVRHWRNEAQRCREEERRAASAYWLDDHFRSRCQSGGRQRTDKETSCPNPMLSLARCSCSASWSVALPSWSRTDRRIR